ncbi:MAG: hypothetical protein ACYC9W_02870 [Candidatus Limnocylindria bacterium]
MILLLSAPTAIFILHLARDLALESGIIGPILGFGAVGALLGAIFAARIARRIGTGPSFILSAVIVTIGLTGRVGVEGPVALQAATIAAMQFVVFFGAALFNVNGPSLRQALTSEHLLGRVNAS